MMKFVLIMECYRLIQKIHFHIVTDQFHIGRWHIGNGFGNNIGISPGVATSPRAFLRIWWFDK